jgi:hypothetical protein
MMSIAFVEVQREGFSITEGSNNLGSSESRKRKEYAQASPRGQTALEIKERLKSG